MADQGWDKMAAFVTDRLDRLSSAQDKIEDTLGGIREELAALRTTLKGQEELRAEQDNLRARLDSISDLAHNLQGRSISFAAIISTIITVVISLLCG